MNELKERNGRVYCDMCNQSFPNEAACEPFLKDGETVVECIERNRKDTDMVLRLLAQEKLRTKQLRELVGELVDDDDCWFDHHGYCQAHGWFYTEPACPHARGKALAGKQPQEGG